MKKQKLRAFFDLFAPTAYFLTMTDVVNAAQGYFNDKEDILFWESMINGVEERKPLIEQFEIDLLMDEIEAFLCVNDKLSKAYILDITRELTEISYYLYGLPMEKGMSNRGNPTHRNVVARCGILDDGFACTQFLKYLYEVDNLFYTFLTRFERKVIDCGYSCKEIEQGLRDRENVYFTANGLVAIEDKDAPDERKNQIADFITHKDKEKAIEVLTKFVQGRKCKPLALVILAAKEIGLIGTAIPFAVLEDIGAIGHKSGYNDYVNPQNMKFTDEEIAMLAQQLKNNL